jgi:hypothetical protein
MDGHDAVINTDMNELPARLNPGIITEYGTAEYIGSIGQLNHQAASDEAISDATTDAPAGFRVTFTGFGAPPEVAIGVFVGADWGPLDP